MLTYSCDQVYAVTKNLLLTFSKVNEKSFLKDNEHVLRFNSGETFDFCVFRYKCRGSDLVWWAAMIYMNLHIFMRKLRLMRRERRLQRKTLKSFFFRNFLVA